MARRFGRTGRRDGRLRLTAKPQQGRTAVLISGSGSNLQALIDAVSAQTVALDIAVVFSNKPEAYGLQRAAAAGIACEVIDNTAFQSREAYDAAVADCLLAYQPDCLMLAGFMRILSAEFVARFAGRIINIHPSLLPAYPGLDTHQRVLDAGDPIHGCTVHFVTAELDGGPAIIRGTVPVLANDDAVRLAARVLDVEHQIYPLAASLLAEGRIRCDGDEVFLDDARLQSPIEFVDGHTTPAI